MNGQEIYEFLKDKSEDERKEMIIPSWFNVNDVDVNLRMLVEDDAEKKLITKRMMTHEKKVELLVKANKNIHCGLDEKFYNELSKVIWDEILEECDEAQDKMKYILLSYHEDDRETYTHLFHTMQGAIDYVKDIVRRDFNDDPSYDGMTEEEKSKRLDKMLDDAQRSFEESCTWHYDEETDFVINPCFFEDKKETK